ncbi:MAG: glycosyltransferase family 2 protein [Pseudomonadota bacterium]
MKKNEAPESDAAPTLSVGLPVYNGGKWIGEAIQSIVEQSFTDLELIISDNASDDETEEICREAVSKDSRIRYYRNTENIGQFANFDRVFELSRGEFFKWAADSDFCLEGFLESCMDVLQANDDAVLTYTQAYLLIKDAHGEDIAVEYLDDFNLDYDRPSDRFKAYLERERINNLMHGVIRSSALRETSLHQPLPGSDISMVAELSLRGKFIEAPGRLFVRRFDKETSSLLMSANTAVARDVSREPTFVKRIKLHSHRFVTAWRAPIAFREKVLVWLYLFRRVLYLRHQIFSRITRLLFG